VNYRRCRAVEGVVEVAVTVRVATSADADAVAAVGRRTWPPTYEPLAGPEYVADGLARYWSAEAVHRGLADNRTLVAQTDDGTVVGMAGFAPQDDVLVLWKLYVLPEAQGTGAGTALLRRVIADATSRYRAVRLEYVAGNDRAAAFYARHGFTFLRREPDADGGPDVVWLERVLSG
jgi:ribosomal protein S18 acetylase RimI-like enzyme